MFYLMCVYRDLEVAPWHSGRSIQHLSLAKLLQEQPAGRLW